MDTSRQPPDRMMSVDGYFRYSTSVGRAVLEKIFLGNEGRKRGFVAVRVLEAHPRVIGYPFPWNSRRWTMGALSSALAQVEILPVGANSFIPCIDPKEGYRAALLWSLIGGR